MERPPLLTLTEHGLHCAAGGFYVDAWGPVDRNIVTHAHSDHARAGARRYLCAAPGRDLLGLRLGDDADIQPLAYGQSLRLGDVAVSLHPAGHILGSAQVRVEQRGQVWVVSGDYKLAPDPTCAAFEPVRCHTFLSESTFGLPVYRWSPPAAILADIQQWWQDNRAQQKTSLLLCYALGKAQRILAGLDPALGPVVVHGAVDRMTDAARANGRVLFATWHSRFAPAVPAARRKPALLALTAALTRLGPGLTEIYCHPATADDWAGAAPGYRYADELAGLTSPAIARLLETSGARTGNFADFASEQLAA